ncbi:MAG TPA: nitrous oxide reductase family maturation protein NosD [Thermomicrobiales bacterium]|nr:nitrous oxide reductase family maturation protein NosD [Thermomicrobiales bacterium]
MRSRNNQPFIRRLGQGLAAVGIAVVLAGPAIPTPPAGAAELEVCPTCTVTSLADAVALAEPGATITVRGGTYPGGMVITKSLTLVGVENPVIDGQEQGTLISASGADLTISGFTLRSTGSNHDREDSAIVVENGKATITDNWIEDALFGIYLKTAHGSVIRNNTILAKPVDIAMRGDGIKIWYCDDVLVEHNEASDGRDIILWYSNRGVVRGNDFNRERYGLHLMFSNDIRIENNSLSENSIGLFIMYSRNPLVIGNTMSNNHGPSGGGMGLKDVDNAVVEGNRFVNNQVGAQIDTSPREMGIENYWKDNVFAFNHTAVALQPSVRHNTFTGNNFIDNGQHVSIVGSGDLKDITWAVDGRGNYWSDYAGYDANGDGVGDVPYRSQRLFDSLLDEQPSLRLFLFSPAAMAVDFAAKALPSVRPQTKLEDPHPLVNPVQSALLPDATTAGNRTRVLTGATGLLFAIPAIVVVGWGRPKRGPRRSKRGASTP